MRLLLASVIVSGLMVAGVTHADVCTDLSVVSVRSGSKGQEPGKVLFGTGDQLFVGIKGLGAAMRDPACKLSPGSFMLFIDGYAIPTTTGILASPPDDVLRFDV